MQNVNVTREDIVISEEFLENFYDRQIVALKELRGSVRDNDPNKQNLLWSYDHAIDVARSRKGGMQDLARHLERVISRKETENDADSVEAEVQD